MSLIAVIDKLFPSAIWIWRLPKYFVTFLRDSTLLVMWLDAPESKYHRVQEEKGLLESPKAENVEIIICWTISGVIGCAKARTFWFTKPPAIEGPTTTIKVVSVILGSLMGIL